MKIKFEEYDGVNVTKHCVPVEEVADIEPRDFEDVIVILKDGRHYVANGLVNFIE